MITLMLWAVLLAAAVALLYYAAVARCAALWYAKWLMRDFRATVLSAPTRGGGWRHTIISRRGVGAIFQEGRRLTASPGTHRRGQRI